MHEVPVQHVAVTVFPSASKMERLLCSSGKVPTLGVADW